MDSVLDALHEELDKGRPTQIPSWKKVEVMSDEAIDAESHAFAEKYEDFWKKLDESGEAENLTEEAYESAFARYPEIHRCLGWRDSQNLMFNAVVLSEHRNALCESIFGIEAYRMKAFNKLHNTSRAFFEFSRLPRLLTILIRADSRQGYGFECHVPEGLDSGIQASTVLKTLIEVARSLRRTNLVDGLNQMSMDELLTRCYARQILKQPDSAEVERHLQHCNLIFDCLTALDFSQRFKEIREPLSGTFYFRYMSGPIHKVLEKVRIHRKQSRGIELFKVLPLQESGDPTFSPAQFNAQYLQEFGGLAIEWSHSIDEHLQIFTRRNAIRVFAHPTFYYNFHDLHRKERDYHEPTYLELSLTYALLFQPSSRSKLNDLQHILKGDIHPRPASPSLYARITGCLSQVLGWLPRRKHLPDTVAVGPNTTSQDRLHAKNLLDSFWRSSLPPTVQATFDISNPSATITPISDRNQDKVTSASMRDLAALPMIPEDIAFMATSVFQPSSSSGFLNTEEEAFVRFPYFGPRLRRLKMYLDNKHPRTLRQLWVDERNVRGWWMFWGGAGLGVFGVALMSVCVILLAMILVRWS